MMGHAGPRSPNGSEELRAARKQLAATGSPHVRNSATLITHAELAENGVVLCVFLFGHSAAVCITVNVKEVWVSR